MKHCIMYSCIKTPCIKSMYDYEYEDTQDNTVVE